MTAVVPKRPARQIPIFVIQHHVCTRIGISTHELWSRGRSRRTVLARRLIVGLARLLTPLSFPEIAFATHRPNHSSVITSHNKLRAELKLDPQPTIGEILKEPGHSLASSTLADLMTKLEAELRRAGELMP